ncbi:hypothetical protein, partial [Cysteiniphilum marinum]|uniref:hypothetical protein n=1 Tax=Cysteiniphilum marinum TaxID=2774191 RepID=UPI001F36EFBD
IIAGYPPVTADIYVRQRQAESSKVNPKTAALSPLTAAKVVNSKARFLAANGKSTDLHKCAFANQATLSNNY